MITELASRVSEARVLAVLAQAPMSLGELIGALGLRDPDQRVLERLAAVLDGATRAGKLVERRDGRWTVTVAQAIAVWLQALVPLLSEVAARANEGNEVD